MRQIKFLVVHCTGGPKNQTISSIELYWKSIGWKRPGYHYLIREDGALIPMYPEHLNSNGVKGYNNYCINISYIGGMEQGKFADTRTEAQKKTLLSILKDLKRRYPNAEIRGHRDFSPDLNKNGTIEPNEYIKMCPCFDAKIEYQKL